MWQRTAWYGPEFCVAGWAPAPRYLLRRDRIMHHLKLRPVGRALEIGSASGALLSELDDRGFNCTGVESSAKAIEIARNVNASRDIKFHTKPDDSWEGQFDYCMAFEVLEHIEHDRDALTEWAKLIRPGGTMLLSVPAHPRLWNARDVWAGHFRRYRKSDLESVFAAAGLNVEKIECYGFPLANILELIFARSAYKSLKKSQEDINAADKAKQTAESGIERTTHLKVFPFYTRFPGSWVMRFMIAFQKLFLNLGIGNGYLVVATKP